MTTNGQPPKPSITEVARRYHAAAIAVATTFGITLEEVLNERREIVTAVFMQASREGLKLPATVELPTLATAPPLLLPANGDPQASGAPRDLLATPVEDLCHDDDPRPSVP